MAYIIDQIRLMEDNQIVTRSILVDGNEFRFKEKQLDQFRFMKMDGSPYFMTPGFVMLDQNIQHLDQSHSFKLYVKNLIQKGCTFLIAAVDLPFERQWDEKKKHIRKVMMNSPIDYAIAAKIPIERLTPSIIRMLKREKITVIIVEIKQIAELDDVPWEWIRETLFPKQTPIFPHFSSEDQSIFHQLKSKWQQIVKKYKLPSLEECPENGVPLTKEALMKIGLYPIRGEILSGSNVDYNLFRMIDLVEENNYLDYYNHNPEVIVHNGSVLKAGEQIFYKPGFGKEVQLNAPGRFNMYSQPINKY
ncbi:hypothetical protein A3Q35_03750 [Aeribacillus pallidus]|uniref:hypothetical protein n=1 Tax=Aeribacillus pallidus TaxID=33936 RepID=UPI0007B4C357|nr:hypothetical protein [Aeribacillus pallidus]KZM52688.1 hypothetical protein A3Q35_03750 [Aeribacillus pallidus]